MIHSLVKDFFKKFLLTILSLLMLTFVSAEKYPIMVRTQLTPPYTLYLSDYTKDMALTVIIQPWDQFIENYRVKLVVEIKGDNLQLISNTSYIKELYINGNEPITLTGDELGDMFAPQNLTLNGADKGEFYRTGKLPEGFYTFTFSLFDYYKDIRVSEQVPAMAFLVMNDPPLINEPYNKERIRVSDPQNILFQWTPRHTASPNSAFSSEYEFSLYEVLDKSMSAGDVVRSAKPLHTEVLNTTSLLYGADKPQLIPGNDYVFRVQARDVQGHDLFKNNGYSEAFRFTYGSVCMPPSFINTRSIAGNGVEVKWDQGIDQSNFEFQYRKKGITAWTPVETDGASAKIYELVEGETYYVQIKSMCGTFGSEWSSEMEFTAPPKKETKTYACSGKDDIATITNTAPLQSLKKGDYFVAGDYSAKVTKVSGGNGVFSGECLVTVPFYAFANVPHTFTNIKLNTDGEMFEGELLSVYNVNSKFVTSIELGDDNSPEAQQKAEFKDGEINMLALPPTEVKGTIESVTLSADGKKVEIKTADGTITTLDAGKPLLLADESNNEYTVDSKGNVKKVPENLVNSGNNSNNKNTAATDPNAPKLIFQPKINADNVTDKGFDALPNDVLKRFYKSEEINGVDVYIPWKAMRQGVADKVNLQVSNASGKTIKVTDEEDKELALGEANKEGTREVTLLGQPSAEDKFEITASYTQTDDKGREKQITAARLNLVTYEALPTKLVLVPVNGAKIDKVVVGKYLNDIYGPAVVEFTVDAYTDLSVTEFNSVAFDDGSTEFLSNYSTDMKTVIAKFEEANAAYDKDAFYLFIMPGDPKTSGKYGQMPLSRQFGFIFSKQQSADEVKHTIAHEIGHGAFRLSHTWTEYGTSQSSTTNLMDYGSGTTLWKPQWDWIHDPGFRFYGLQDEKDGASFGNASIICVSSVSKYFGTTFLNPDGKPIDIGDATPYAFFSIDDSDEKLKGTLARFLKDGKLYSTYYNKLTNTFEGYAPKAFYKTHADFDKAVYIPSVGNIADAQVFMGNPNTCEYDIKKNGVSLLGSTKGKLTSCVCEDKTDKEYIEGVRKDLIFSKLNWHDGAIANQSYLIKYISPSGQPLEIPSDWRVLVLNESSSEPYMPMTDAIYGFENKSDKKVYVADIENKEFKGYFDDKGNIYTYKLTGAKHTNPGICTGVKLEHFHFYLYNNGTKGIDDLYYCKNLATNTDMTGMGSVLHAITYCYNECETKAFCQQDKINISFTTLFNNNTDYKYNIYGDGGSLYTYKVGDQTFYIYANKDSKQKWYYYKYNANQPSCCERWEYFNYPYPDLNEQVQLVVNKVGHGTLDVIGFAPLVGELADLANGTWYLFEGEKGEAALCYASMLPLVGDIGVKGSKYTIKAYKTISKAAEVANEIEMSADASMAFVRIGKELNARSVSNFSEILSKTGILLTKHGDKAAEIEKLLTSVPTEKLQAVLSKINALDDVKRVEFLSSIKYADNLPATHIARNLEKVDEAVIESYQILSATALKTDINWLKRANDWKQYELAYTQVGDVVQLTGKNGDEIAQIVKEGDDLVLEITEDYIVSSGKGTAINTTVRTGSGDNIINGAILKTDDGIRFIEDVSSYGTSVQQTIKQRYKLREALTGIKATEEAHHVIPVQLLKENDVVRKAVEGGFEFNTTKNGLAIEKYSKASGAGRHASHPEYTKQIEARLNSWASSKNYNYSAKDAKEFLEVITEDIKFVIENPLNSKVKINALKLGL